MDFATPPPAHQQMMMDTITVGDVEESDYHSQGSDVEMDDVDSIGDSQDDMLSDTSVRPSIETDETTTMRGGILDPPPNLAWARKMAVASWYEKQRRNRRGVSALDLDADDMMVIDYRSRAPGTTYEDDGLSTSSDWDDYGNLPLTMGEYDVAVSGLEGSEDWNSDQRKVHKLLYMRGLHPMMPSWWRVSFRMWGVTQPHLDDVFTPKLSNKRVVIHAYGNEVAAAKALESLFYLSQNVTDYEEIGYEDKIASTVVKAIRGYIKWALRDADIDKRRTQLNMLVQTYPPNFYDDSESAGSDFAPSPISDNDAGVTGRGAFASAAKAQAAHGLDEDALEAERQRRFTRAVSRDLERRLLEMGQRWRELLRKKRRGSGGGGGAKGRYTADPPTLYAFAVIQHIVLLASHDCGNPGNPVVVLEQVRLNDRGQWLWNALSIAIPVNVARDALNSMWETGVVVRRQKDSGEDPDL